MPIVTCRLSGDSSYVKGVSRVACDVQRQDVSRTHAAADSAGGPQVAGAPCVRPSPVYNLTSLKDMLWEPGSSVVCGGAPASSAER